MNFLSLTYNRLLILLMIGLTLSINNAAAEGRDPGGVASDAVGSQILSSYSGSYALLIGESQYTNGWSNLESIPGELREVEKVLQSQGFKVEMSLNLNAKEFAERFNRFINQYGFEENNRLLFFYSGHGYTRKAKGYIVPVDAANPNFDETAFLRKAVGMNQITTWARRIEAKHVLFLFDSCFSGTVFKAKSLPKMPPQISQAAALPVRQFITAGSANETVPAQSVFAPAFVDALRYGWGDLYKDGYVTGEELGLYLNNKVPQHTEQTPQYGKIQDYKLSRGDFIFVVGGGVTVAIIPPASTTMPVPKPDIDKDGVNDDQDKCPRNTPLEISKGIDARGCPLDSDWDGVADYQDSCPNTSSGVNVKKNGCSIPVPVSTQPSPPVVVSASQLKKIKIIKRSKKTKTYNGIWEGILVKVYIRWENYSGSGGQVYGVVESSKGKIITTFTGKNYAFRELKVLLNNGDTLYLHAEAEGLFKTWMASNIEFSRKYK